MSPVGTVAFQGSGESNVDGSILVAFNEDRGLGSIVCTNTIGVAKHFDNLWYNSDFIVHTVYSLTENINVGSNINAINVGNNINVINVVQHSYPIYELRLRTLMMGTALMFIAARLSRRLVSHSVCIS